jgi:hypothetical protein
MKMIDVAEVSELAKDQMGRVDEKEARRFPDKNERVKQRPKSQRVPKKKRRTEDSCYRRHRQGYRGTKETKAAAVEAASTAEIPQDTGFGGLVRNTRRNSRGAANHNYDRHQ